MLICLSAPPETFPYKSINIARDNFKVLKYHERFPRFVQKHFDRKKPQQKIFKFFSLWFGGHPNFNKARILTMFEGQ